MARRRTNAQKTAPYWIAIIVGLGLVIFPDPLTTATGLAILAGTFAISRVDGADRKRITESRRDE